jgi:acetoin utilization deacetylase AcuC-like enzyme
MAHTVPEGIPDQPARLEQVYSTLRAMSDMAAIDIFEDPPEADARIIGAVHTSAYIRELVDTAPLDRTTPPRPLKPVDGTPDTFVSLDSLKAATLAAGSVCDAVERVTSGSWHTAFCAVRPPGHHVGRNGRALNARSQGACLLNNVAIGAAHAMLRAHSERVAIVDLDATHGNGTEEIFAANPSFLICSVHVVGPGVFPGTGTSSSTTPPNILNVPLPVGTSGVAWLEAINTHIVPALFRFMPYIILLSTGFNGHRDDPTRLMQLTAQDYYNATRTIVKVADKIAGGRVVSVLEGGWESRPRSTMLQDCTRAHILALMGETAAQAIQTQQQQPIAAQSVLPSVGVAQLPPPPPSPAAAAPPPPPQRQQTSPQAVAVVQGPETSVLPLPAQPNVLQVPPPIPIVSQAQL